MNKIEQAIGWANKRLELQGKKLDDTQIEYLTLAFKASAGDSASELPNDEEIQVLFPTSNYQDTIYNGGKQDGAKWMRQFSSEIIIKKDGEIFALKDEVDWLSNAVVDLGYVTDKKPVQQALQNFINRIKEQKLHEQGIDILNVNDVAHSIPEEFLIDGIKAIQWFRSQIRIAPSEAVAFAEWQYKNTWSVSGGSDELWWNQHTTGRAGVTTSELYKAFKADRNQQSKQEGKEQDENSAEFHVFESTITKTQEKVWQYFYNDENDLNQHSEYYETKEQAINAYTYRFLMKDIKLGEIFKVDGKKYLILLPKSDQQLRDANGHGHLVCDLFNI